MSKDRAVRREAKSWPVGMPVWKALPIAAALLFGCGGSSTGQPCQAAAVSGGLAEPQIVGGVPALADSAVAALLLGSQTCELDPTPDQFLCTGVLVGPRAILTAAHCLRGLTPADLRVFFGNDVGASGGVTLDVVWVQSHPAWSGRSNDIALLGLAEDVAAVPVEMLEELDAVAVGSSVRVVGFGVDECGGIGVKREGTAQIRSIAAATFTSNAAPGMSCEGDSGGPVFLTQRGTEYVAGVTSGGDAACTTGVNTRVDQHVEGFIRDGLVQIDDLPDSRPPIDLAANYCESSCQTDADCPQGMGCLVGDDAVMRCGLQGFGTGSFTDRCSSSSECTDGVCAATAGCRCYQSCDAPAASSTTNTAQRRQKRNNG